MFSSTAAFQENPATGIELSLNLFYPLDGLAENMLQLIGHALIGGRAVRRQGP